jgi:hypothetical protein
VSGAGADRSCGGAPSARDATCGPWWWPSAGSTLVLRASAAGKAARDYARLRIARAHARRASTAPTPRARRVPRAGRRRRRRRRRGELRAGAGTVAGAKRVRRP